MIDIDRGDSPDAPVASPPSTQRNPSRDGWGCLVFGPSLLRLDIAAGPVRIGKSPHGRDFGQELSGGINWCAQWGLRMVGPRCRPGLALAATLAQSPKRDVSIPRSDESRSYAHNPVDWTKGRPHRRRQWGRSAFRVPATVLVLNIFF